MSIIMKALYRNPEATRGRNTEMNQVKRISSLLRCETGLCENDSAENSESVLLNKGAIGGPRSRWMTSSPNLHNGACSCDERCNCDERCWVAETEMMNAMTAEDYKETYWPRLEKAVEQLLTQSPVKYSSVSYELIYSYVYKCVCQQYSEHLFRDLIRKITSHLQQVCLGLQDSRSESFIENFNLAFTQYTTAIQCIISVFVYLNKFYIETKLNRDLKDDLMNLFSAHVAEKHINTLISLLKKADAIPLQVKPSTMASVVKGLYDLQPDWAQLAPALFSKFIPQLYPPVLESDLLRYAAQDQKLQMELLFHGFSSCDPSHKRAREES